MPWLLILALGGGGYYVYDKKKKNPNWSPLAALTGKKKAALEKVKATSTPTPAVTAGLDPNMTSGQVAQVNAALAGATDPAPVYAMASDLSSAYPNSATALIAKADALQAAKASGASDSELLQNMLAAGTYSFPEGS